MAALTTVWWCIECPTRVKITHDGAPLELFWNRAYFTCPACGGALWEPAALARGEFVRADGERFTFGKHATGAERHAAFIAFASEKG